MRKFFAVAMGSVVALVGFSGEGNAFVCSPHPITTLSVSSGVIPFSGSGSVEVTNGNALTLGSTDVVMEFDPSVLQALGASSATLSNFAFNIDNVAGTVTTASAAFPGDELGAGDEFFTVAFETTALPGTSTSITLSDPDVDECGYYYLAGPVPPIPPAALQYSVTSGLETVPEPTSSLTIPSGAAMLLALSKLRGVSRGCPKSG